jgi:two-component system KDP operon response regulator KdpE
VLHTELLTKVWGPEYRDDIQYLRVWVSRLRRKLEPDPRKIASVEVAGPGFINFRYADD